jgi:hypothetical protein
MQKPNAQSVLTALILVLASPVLPTLAQEYQLIPARAKQLPDFRPAVGTRNVNTLMYQRIKPGMTLSQVENIIGFGGTPNPEAAFGAQQAYTWKNTDGSGITVWVRNNQVTIVGKFGLPEVDIAGQASGIPLLSYSIFELVKPQMTLEDVESIFGFPGRLEPELSTIETAQVWRWDDLNGDYIRVYFGEGRVVSKFTSILNLRPTGIIQAEVNAEKIQLGMTQREVERLLKKGTPYPDPYETEFESWFWKYDDGSVLLVVFDEDSVIVVNPR